MARLSDQLSPSTMAREIAHNSESSSEEHSKRQQMQDAHIAGNSSTSLARPVTELLDLAIQYHIENKGVACALELSPAIVGPGIVLGSTNVVVIPLETWRATYYLGHCSAYAVAHPGGVFSWDARLGQARIRNKNWNTELIGGLLAADYDVLGVSLDPSTCNLSLEKVFMVAPRVQFVGKSNSAPDSSWVRTVLVRLPLPHGSSSSSTSSVHMSTLGQGNKIESYIRMATSSTMIISLLPDTNYAFQPEESYSLVMSYSMTRIHVASPLPQPTDAANALERFGAILRSWPGPSTELKSGKLLVCPLFGQYPLGKLAVGSYVTGFDKLLILYIRNVMRDCDLQAYLGILARANQPSGCTGQDGSAKDTHYDFRCTTSLSGVPVLPHASGLSVRAGELVRLRHSLSVLPCAAILLYPGNNEGEILFRSGGIQAVLQRLHQLDTTMPSKVAKTLIDRITLEPLGLRICGFLTRSLAIKWKDIDVWYTTIDPTDPRSVDVLLEGFVHFSFATMIKLLGDFILRTDLSSALRVINTLPKCVQEDYIDFVKAWAPGAILSILRKPRLPKLSDIPTVIYMAGMVGCTTVLKEYFPSVENCAGSFYFWLRLFEVLSPQNPIVHSSATAGAQPQGVDSLRDYCLLSAIRLIRLIEETGNHQLPSTQIIQRVIDFVSICGQTNTLSVLPILLGNFVPSAGDDQKCLDEYNHLYIPLYPRLFHLLHKFGQDFYTGALGDWFRHHINIYVNTVVRLAPKKTVTARTIGCPPNNTHPDCVELNRFINDHARVRMIFKVGVDHQRRSHICSVVEEASDLVFVQAPGKLEEPLEVTKLIALVEYQAWERTREDAQNVLRTFGYPFLMQLLGETKVQEMLKSLKLGGDSLWLGECEIPVSPIVTYVAG